ncbi:MAG: PDZ domain-containing protein [Deltaproteobacteria bacterium]|nr:PDZ domain-containing protein [Deltaproteobacteria bacterium]
MDILFGDDQQSPQEPEKKRMNRYIKPLIVAVALIAALFLTITDRGDAGLDVALEQQSRAEPDRKRPRYDLTALSVFTGVLGRVKGNYVEPGRLRPKEMLFAALDAVERNVAEVIAEPSSDKSKLKVRVHDAERTFDVSGVDSPWALSGRMKAIFRFIQPHLDRDTEIRDVEYAAINGMLSTLDPHSLLLKPELYNEMKLSTRGEFGGLGIVISMIQGVLTVMNPMKGTPAQQVGIKACDQILKIGEESTINMTLNQAVSRLRGRPNSTVQLTIARGPQRRRVKKTITRAIIKVDSVTSQMLAKRVGYVRLSNFQGNTTRDLRKALTKLKRKGMRRLILDLRGNPGGLLDQAIKISDLFIESGTLLTTVSHAGKQREEKRAKASETEPRYPIAVLVDSGSASASEIVAGALKNLDRAVVIGQRTFGKGSVQVLYDNDDGSALKLTIAQYLTPGDVSIQSVGITPDIVTDPIYAREDFVRLRRATRRPREEHLLKHLTSSNVRRGVKPTKVVRYLEEPRGEKKEPPEPKNYCLYPNRQCDPAEASDKFVEDFQIEFARDLLVAVKGWRRSAVLAEAERAGVFAKRRLAEHKKVEQKLKKLGIDWSTSLSPAEIEAAKKKKTKGQRVQGPKLAVTVNGTRAKACEKAVLKVTVRNNGTRPIEQLRALTKSQNQLFDDHELIFGKLAPGQSRTWTTPLRLRDAPSRMDDVSLVFSDALGRQYPRHTFHMTTKGVLRPTFAYGYQLIDDISGNMDGRAQRGEGVRLLVNVRNTGAGKALRAVTTLTNLAGLGIFVRKGRFVLGELSPGETRVVAFTLDVQPTFSSDSFKLKLRVCDDGLGECVTDKLDFDVAEHAQGPTAGSGAVRVSAAQADFHAWGSNDAPVVGWAKRGSAFTVLGRQDSWYRVLVAKDRPAFVSAKDVSPGKTPDPRGFRARLQVTPPKLAVKAPRTTSADKVTISGVASDETRVSDLFIFVRNPRAKVEARKVFYRSNRNSKNKRRLNFSAVVPVWEGSNYVTIHARENSEVQSSEFLVVYRKPVPKVAAKR